MIEMNDGNNKTYDKHSMDNGVLNEVKIDGSTYEDDSEPEDT